MTLKTDHLAGGQFYIRVQDALANAPIRANFRKAMDGLMHKRATALEDTQERESLRELAANVRLRALARLPELLIQLEKKCQSQGIQVHWAQDAQQACEQVLAICQQRQARTVIKGKSMVSEEMELNHFLAEAGIEALESDLGEYIVQLAQETPSHIIMPAIHKNTQQISQLMHEKTGTQLSHDVAYLTECARQQLRERFQQADIGLSGVNFAVAETGTLCLVENEGNGRLTTSVPSCHIAVMGIEKVVEHLEDVTPLLSLLTRSATGQAITTYFNMISRPRQPDEKDGPEVVHLILVDNGRAHLYQDPELRDTLRCIRCGACMNHCPVYTRIGGHAYGTTYPGPIGKILMPHLTGFANNAALPSASTLCGACAEVCPVKIPIPDILVRLRREAVNGDQINPSVMAEKGFKRTWKEALAWQLWAYLAQRPRLYQIATKIARLGHYWMPQSLGAWTQVRTAPRPAAKSLSQLRRDAEKSL
ncbi:L-lactate dehydrogenase complex protein LldF [Allopseudospirillum japonicum]|uniref:L-lactate dehydrogenase complex protein LldF n=1 Tax=Allopseudospirillum japonicum TaxID=64971 RepID=A0A1H6RM83_9GAMM|nr:LutB/LldF family L-lactate oxidation iron-sulfur protein [Allopseudospirillum japonicum]SEI55596.1 L-lactate dehydrogenase complex protein LldF [Allopseudospirillum japonicum]